LMGLLSVPAHAQTQTAFFKKPVDGEAPFWKRSLTRVTI
jgi:hypothetical protein